MLYCPSTFLFTSIKLQSYPLLSFSYLLKLPPYLRWTSIGFQGDNPASDLRAMGILSIFYLIYFSLLKRKEASA